MALLGEEFRERHLGTWGLCQRGGYNLFIALLTAAQETSRREESSAELCGQPVWSQHILLEFCWEASLPQAIQGQFPPLLLRETGKFRGGRNAIPVRHFDRRRQFRVPDLAIRGNHGELRTLALHKVGQHAAERTGEARHATEYLCLVKADHERTEQSAQSEQIQHATARHGIARRDTAFGIDAVRGLQAQRLRHEFDHWSARAHPFQCLVTQGRSATISGKTTEHTQPCLGTGGAAQIVARRLIERLQHACLATLGLLIPLQHVAGPDTPVTPRVTQIPFFKGAVAETVFYEFRIAVFKFPVVEQRDQH
jgi:hypothetical protein